MKKAATLLVLSFLVLDPVGGAVIFEEHFAMPPHAAGGLPAGWTAGEGGTNNDFVVATPLNYPGLVDRPSGSWLHDGSPGQRYHRDFSPIGLVAGRPLFYSMLFKVNAIGKMNNAGPTASAILLATGDKAAPGGGTVAGFSIRKDSADATKFNVAVSTNFRGPGNNTSSILGLETWGATGGRTFAEGETLFVVVEYIYQTSTSSTVRFWINPESASLGGEVPPAPTISLSGTTTLCGVPVQRFLVNSLYSTSNAVGTLWSIDAIRIGDSWADVTPSSGPVSFARTTKGRSTPLIHSSAGWIRAREWWLPGRIAGVVPPRSHRWSVR